MSDGIVIPLDVDDRSARTKVARLKKDAAAAGRAYAQAGAVASRMGGPAGGFIGRATGGFAMGAGAGWAGLGMASGGLLLSGFLRNADARAEAARASVERQHARDVMSRNVMDRVEARKAGAVGMASLARRIIARGDDQNRVAGALSTGARYGLNLEQSLGAMEAAGEHGLSTLDVAIGSATGFLGDNPSEVAGNIAKFNGLQNAVGALAHVSSDVAGDMIGRTIMSAESRNVARATSGRMPVESSQWSDLLSGATADAVARGTLNEMNPGAKLAYEAGLEAQKRIEILKAMAESEDKMAYYMREIGLLFGGQGSHTRRYMEGAQLERGDLASPQ